MAGFVASTAEKQMTQETQEVAPVVETQNTSTVPTEIKPEIVDPGSTDSETSNGDESEAKPEKTAEQKEIERLRRQVTKAQRNNGRLHQEAQTYKQQVEQYSQQQTPQEQGERREPQADPHQLAREIATVEKVTELSNKVAQEGRSKFKDFDASLGTVIEEAGELINSNGKPTAIGAAILESDTPAALIDFLGKNPDLASELEGLTPTQLGRRIERIEAQMKTTVAKPASKASEPISPLKGGSGNVVKSLEKMSFDEYKAARRKQGAKW